MIRLAHFVTHPVQYFTPLYRELAAQPGIALTVFFGSNFGLAPSFDKGFGQTIQFDVPLLSGYEHRFLTNRGFGVPTHGYRNFDCPEVEDLLRTKRFDAVWIHGWAYKLQRQVINAARRHGIPYMIRAETNLLHKPKYSLRWVASRLQVGRMLRAAAACLYIGRGNRDFYASMGVAPACLLPAHYAVDGVRFRDAADCGADRSKLRQSFGAGEDDFVVVCAGKAIPRKRLQDAIAAVGKLEPSVWLWILGDGPLRSQLEQQAARDAPGRVCWHGFVNQSRMPGMLAGADLFLMPSEAEPWGLAVNEAMAVGLPVVCSEAVGCAADLVRPNETGFIYPAGDVATLAEKLTWLVTNREICRRLGRAGQELVLKEYDVTSTARQIAEAVRAVVPSPARVVPATN